MRKFIFMAIACVSCFSVDASPIFYWGSDGGLDLTEGDVYYTDGQLVAENSDWLVELVNIADDIVLHSVTDGFLDGGGMFYADVVDADGWAGLSVKTVIYNSNVKSNATLKAEFTSQHTFTTWGDPPPASVADYYAGGVTPVLGTDPGQWQAVPEPAVASFILIFGGSMLIGRRFFSWG